MVKLVEVSSELTPPPPQKKKKNPDALSANNEKALEHLVEFYTRL